MSARPRCTWHHIALGSCTGSAHMQDRPMPTETHNSTRNLSGHHGWLPSPTLENPLPFCRWSVCSHTCRLGIKLLPSLGLLRRACRGAEPDPKKTSRNLRAWSEVLPPCDMAAATSWERGQWCHTSTSSSYRHCRCQSVISLLCVDQQCL